MSRYFIDRPIFAYVLAVMIVIAGLLAVRTLPIAQFPAIAPPAVSITATYPGADAQTLENTTTQIIEQQLKGLDHLRYFSSSSSSAGTVTITITFEQGTNPDIAQVQVQNKLQAATPLLPQEVQRQGIIVAKATQNILLFVGLYSENGQHDADDLADIVASKIQDPLARVTGVGDTQIFGSQYAMRIWVDPLKLNNYALTMTDVTNAVTAQNAQVSAGQIGAQPAPKDQMLNATVSVSSRLTSPAEQFAQIRLKTEHRRIGGAIGRCRTRRDRCGKLRLFRAVERQAGVGHRGQAGARGSNALNTVVAVKARVNELAKQFPPDVKVIFPYDTSPFVRLSIEQVIETLVEAVVLVFLVMFLFLQNFRATLIPTIAVPVVLTGTFAVLAAFGYSINTLTLFGMVLAIGLLVDDAIVVVENVERLITTEHHDAQGGRAAIDGGDHRRTDRHRAGAVGGVSADGVLWRIDRRHLPPVLHHHRLGHGAVGCRGAGADASALCATILKPHDPTKHEGNGPLARSSSAGSTIKLRPGTRARYETRCAVHQRAAGAAR